MVKVQAVVEVAQAKAVESAADAARVAQAKADLDKAHPVKAEEAKVGAGKEAIAMAQGKVVPVAVAQEAADREPEQAPVAPAIGTPKQGLGPLRRSMLSIST